jgi:glycosyltransferase involved in cell wall biosynthesis
MMFFALQARAGRWPLWKKILAENTIFQKAAGKILFGGRFPDADHVLFAYSYAARDLFREAKRRGWTTVLGQIDPGPAEQRLVDGLRAGYPEWAGSPEMVPPPHYWEEWREECELADRIVVNSEWSKKLLVKEGVAAEKMVVVPLAYSAESRGRQDWGTTGPQERGTKRLRDEGTKGQPSPAKREETGRRGDQLIGDDGPTGQREVAAATGATWKGGNVEKCEGEFGDQKLETGGKSYPERFTKERPMQVLFLGQANVRKGIQDLVEAARLLGAGPWRFDVVGRHGALPPGIPSWVVFHGQVPRREARRWYEEADVFLLPTHSDGFALTQLEAMAHGLPVVATSCCGAVVQDGVNGVLVPAGDPGGLAGVIRDLAHGPRQLEAMSRAACETVREFGIDRVAQGLLAVARGGAGR